MGEQAQVSKVSQSQVTGYDLEAEREARQPKGPIQQMAEDAWAEEGWETEPPQSEKGRTDDIAPAPPARRQRRGQEPPTVSEEFCQRMIERFGAQLGGSAGVNERIGEALNHKAVLKAIDVERYVQGWLRRDAEQTKAKQSAPGSARRGAATVDPFEGIPMGDIRRQPQWVIDKMARQRAKEQKEREERAASELLELAISGPPEDMSRQPQSELDKFRQRQKENQERQERAAAKLSETEISGSAQ